MTHTAIIDVEYEQPACPTQHAWARVPVEPTPSQRAELKARIRQLLNVIYNDVYPANSPLKLTNIIENGEFGSCAIAGK